ncbi:MAG: transglycosylase SLT domain-containing protein [Marinifilaceae bacterium]|jgi:membrane-bound lytic murein transglycosylase D|nr:LysM peptidoglycan-binding domain-containing protein [Marinilabiliaceae bacterium JC040]MCT4599422.1 transglycosylase SLT domain-containing protein [Marinifilaceae bacterium]
MKIKNIILGLCLSMPICGIAQDNIKVDTVITHQDSLAFKTGILVDSLQFKSQKKEEVKKNNFPDMKVIVNNIDDDIDSSFIEKIELLHKKWYCEEIDSLDDLSQEDLRALRKTRIILSDKEIQKKMDTLQYNSAVQLTFNKIVNRYIKHYTVKARKQTCLMLGLSDYYFPIFEEELDRAGLPLELKYLPIIESALNPRAYSRVGAAGLWQFMYRTGKHYKLNITSYVDERRDPRRATQAAVQYLKDLYGMYNDWMLAIAAYNCGQGNVNKAIRRSGGKKNYWDVYFYLPRETRGYVPTFIAAMYVFNYYEDYKLKPISSSFPPICDTLTITKKLHFEQISEVAKVPIEKLKEYNPQYVRNIVPSSPIHKYSIVLPYEYIPVFIEHQDSIMAHNRKKYFDNSDRVVDPRARRNSYYASYNPSGTTRITYKVKRGDVVGKIAEKFHVYSSSISRWNRLRRNRIKVGQKLVIYVPNKYINRVKNYRNVKVNGSVRLAKGSYTYHRVRRGENLWTIARHYPGVSNKDIMKWNNIRNVKMLKPGMRLKIKIH